MQVDLVGDGPGAGDAVDVQHAPREPFLVLEGGHDDLSDAEGGDRQIVRAQAERRLADDPGGAGGEERAYRPGQKHRQAEPAKIALGGGVDRLDHRDGRVEDRAIKEEAQDQDQRDRQQPCRARQPRIGPDRGQDRCGCDHDGQQEAGAAAREGARRRRHRHEHRRQPAKRHEAHDPDVEEARIAPLDIHAKRKNRRDQPHVEDAERGVPAAGQGLEADQRGHGGKQERRAEAAARGGIGLTNAHTAFPLNRPVGLNSSTMIRIAKLTANLYSVDRSCISPSGSSPAGAR